MRQPRQPDLQRFLDRLTSRSVLSEAEQLAILNLPTHLEHVEPNKDFVRLGQRVPHACFVVEGLVGRFDQNSDGGRQITALHIPGDMPDLHSVVQPRATSALQALSPTTILLIPHEAVRAIAAAHPAIAEALWRDCMVDAMILAQWVVNVGRRDAKTRIAHLICEMALRCNGDQLSGRIVFNLPMTQTHLADATGLTSVHVNRSLKALQDEGLEFRRGRVFIADWTRSPASATSVPAISSKMSGPRSGSGSFLQIRSVLPPRRTRAGCEGAFGPLSPKAPCIALAAHAGGGVRVHR